MKVPMTVNGERKLRQELEHLKRVERPEVVAAIAEARAHGDLKENAEYHAAKERQGFIEARIKDIEGKLSHAQIIDISKMQNDGRVIFGSTVTLVDMDTEAKVMYQIVGDDEADIKAKKISVHSPIARALIGKEQEDVVSVTTPGGVIEYEIEKVDYI